ncbi:MAG: hypothetical protein HY006_01480 [Candidatus Sungbacteria bacterium]|nr:hypothetical protein [Candidatus Sungbacteria bacterium]
MGLLLDFLKELETIDPHTVPEPRSHSNTGYEETIAGVADEGIRKLYGLGRKLAKRGRLLDAREEAHHAAPIHDQQECMTLHRDRVCLEQMCGILDRMFWGSIRYQFPEIPLIASLGICKGWVIVWYVAITLHVSGSESDDMEPEGPGFSEYFQNNPPIH